MTRFFLAAVLAAASLAAAAQGAPGELEKAQRAPGEFDKVRLAPRELGSPHYGDVLFRFFQDRHFDALTSLMVSQHFRRVAPHDDDAEVLRGGLLLGYGMHREAGEVFARLIENHASPAVRDRAWYFLAKIRYQRGLAVEAEEALARIGSPLAGALEEDRTLLRAQLLMARADHAGAAALLASLPPTASLYARFNLGVALVKAGDLARGSALLDQIGLQPAADEEQRSLRDRANVALGFAALQAKHPAEAQRYLQRVRLDGLAANKALLGFGWAQAELGEPKSALVPWNELAGRALSDPAVLEARIAVPYALAELGASGQALARYEAAVKGFDGERRALDESIAAIGQGKLESGLLERNAGSGMGWFGSLDRLPPQMPHGGHLAALLAGHEFQEAFKNLRDLVFLGSNLGDWGERLTTFEDMLANRRQAFAERLPRMRQQAGAVNLPALQRRRDALAQALARAEREGDPAVFIGPRHLKLLERLVHAESFLKDAPDTPEFDEARERLRRVAGALVWELTQDFPGHLWQAKRELGELDAALAEAKARDAALLAAAAAEPARNERFAARITALAQRIAELAPRVTALEAEQRAHLQGLAVAELEDQKERLAVYASQARLAIAQLLDRAQLAERKPEAPPSPSSRDEVPR